MANTKIVPMPESFNRLGVALETTTDSSTYGTWTDPGSGTPVGGIVRCIEPKWGTKSNRLNYNEGWESALTSQSHAYRRMETLNHKAYFYVPAGASTVTALGAYYKALLLPSGMTFSLTGSDYIFTLDNDFLDTAATPDVMKRHGASIELQEYKECRRMKGARNNFKLDFGTDKGMLLDMDWTGMSYGTGVPIDCTATLFAKPAHAGSILDFASAQFFICAAADAAVSVPTTTYYPICKAMQFDAGAQPVPLDDCNGAYGMDGVHIGNLRTGMKVSFDIARPITHGSTISGTSMPWLTDYLDGTQMYAQMDVVGATGYGVKLQWVFQLEDEPDQSMADGLRRMKIGGSCKSATIAAGTLDGFKMTVYNNA